MSNDSEKWEWVDEDPIAKLLQTPAVSAAPVASPAEGLMAAGRAHFEQLRFEEAARSFAAALASEPDHPAAQFDLAVCLEKLGQWKPAAFSFRRTLEMDPGCVEALIGLGACLLHLNRAEEALVCFEQCGRAALLGKAVALQQLSRYEEADPIYRELLAADPGAVEPLANLIALSVARQDVAAVEEYSRQLLRVHPQSKAALQGLAILAIRNGDQATAIEYCSRLVEIDPDTFEGWFNLRFAQQRMTTGQQSARSIA